MKLFTVRHGETVWNVEHRVCGISDKELTERGREMAEEMAFEIAAKGGQSKQIKVQPRTHKGEWLDLGTYDFEKGDQSYIKIMGNQSKGAIFADAILLVPTN